MISPQAFLTTSLRRLPQGESITRILAAAFDAADPAAAVARFLSAHPLPAARRVYALGLGKAAPAMMKSLMDLTDINAALVITKHMGPLDLGPATVIRGDHPIPGDSSLAAGRAALEFVSRLTPDDLLICLISGGGSALMTAPLIPLASLQDLTASLLAGGARVEEINTIRRHLDRLKGGGLAEAANGARVISLIMSDVVGDSPEAIASGPTAPDPSTREDSAALLRKYHDDEKIRSMLRETAKAGDDLFKRIENHIIVSNAQALGAAKTQAQAQGFATQIIDEGLQGEAYEMGRELARRMQTKVRSRPFCLLAGGETTVTLESKSMLGHGGRNQELVLAAVEELAKMQTVAIVSLATDGEDGPTDAAGAVATNVTARSAEAIGLRAADFLAAHNAYDYFDALGDLIKIGPSGTNVNDIVLCFAFDGVSL